MKSKEMVELVRAIKDNKGKEIYECRVCGRNIKEVSKLYSDKKFQAWTADFLKRNKRSPSEEEINRASWNWRMADKRGDCIECMFLSNKELKEIIKALRARLE